MNQNSWVKDSVSRREIYKRPQSIGIPARHRGQRETSLTAQNVSESGVPNTTLQYLPVQQYQFQSLPVAPVQQYFNNIPMDKMDSERRFSTHNPMIPIAPQFHVMNYHNHVSSPSHGRPAELTRSNSTVQL